MTFAQLNFIIKVILTFELVTQATLIGLILNDWMSKNNDNKQQH
jgi:hypothetical protein